MSNLSANDRNLIHKCVGEKRNPLPKILNNLYLFSFFSFRWWRNRETVRKKKKTYLQKEVNLTPKKCKTISKPQSTNCQIRGNKIRNINIRRLRSLKIHRHLLEQQFDQREQFEPVVVWNVWSNQQKAKVLNLALKILRTIPFHGQEDSDTVISSLKIRYGSHKLEQN